MAYGLSALLEVINLEELDENLFRGKSPKTTWQRVYGGQVICQALMAASRTVEGRFAHSLHCYFILPGDPNKPIIYQVKRSRDGGSFTTRFVEAIQHGNVIFTMLVSFHKHETGFEYMAEMPPFPKPDELPHENIFREKMEGLWPEAIKEYWDNEKPIEIRLVDTSRYISLKPKRPEFALWFRSTGKIEKDLAHHLSSYDDELPIHQCILAYASDMTLLDTSAMPHGTTIFSEDIQAASLDHAIWFHRQFRADDWLLYVQESSNSSGARGFSQGKIYTIDGKLVASVAQEGLIRQKARKS